MIARPADDEVMNPVEIGVTTPSGGHVPVVSVNGEVDVYSAPKLQEALTGLLEQGSNTIIVDLTDVSFLDSTGLGALVAGRTRAGEAGGALSLVCTQERILKLFTITGLDGVFRIHSSVDLARQAVADSSA